MQQLVQSSAAFFFPLPRKPFEVSEAVLTLSREGGCRYGLKVPCNSTPSTLLKGSDYPEFILGLGFRVYRVYRIYRV